MRERIESLLSEDSSDMWVTTFHSFCAKILRFDIDKLGYDNRFVIYDEQDQTSLITDLMKSCNIDEKAFEGCNKSENQRSQELVRSSRNIHTAIR